jgi:hypothetical protein
MSSVVQTIGPYSHSGSTGLEHSIYRQCHVFRCWQQPLTAKHATRTWATPLSACDSSSSASPRQQTG